MKIEQLLVQYLYDNKVLKLQGLGIFSLADNFTLPAETEKDPVIPDNAISFEYNTKVAEDPALISFIVQKTGKILPLASADLDSYIMLGKQFLNIGKPFRIEGIGTLQKNMQGQYDFVPGQFITPRLDDIPRQLKEKKDDDISFDTALKERSNGSRKGILIAAGILILGLAAWGIWYLVNKPKTKTTTADKIVTPDTIAAIKDSNNIIAKKTDSLKPAPAVVPAADGYTFKIVFKTIAGKDAATKEMDKWIKRNHTVIMYAKDSVSYKLAEPFKLPLTDTTYVLDSLKKFYHPKAHIEL